MQHFNTKKTAMAIAVSVALSLGLAACGGDDATTAATPTTNSWMSASIIAEQAAATTDAAKEAVALKRAKALIAAMTLDQKLQQLTGANPEILPDMPQCLGGRHVTGIAALNIPTFRITNGPVGLGQNDCIDPAAAKTNPYGAYAAYVDPSSAKATALPSAMAAAASFDPSVAGMYGEVIGTEMLNLALHEFEAPGMNMARLPILGRNFEYFGEDPLVAGTMSVAEISAIQKKGLIGMAKHYVGNEQETNRETIRENIDHQVLRELYLLPFEMSVKDGKVASIMCAYNYVNGQASCENQELLTDILRTDWGFTGYVQSDFFATKTTLGTMTAGMDFMMPTPQQWSKPLLSAEITKGTITIAQIDKALERRYTQMFKYGIFERQPLKQTAIDFTGNGAKARDIGIKSAVLLQNNGALPFDGTTVKNVVVIGKSSQVYAQQAVAGGAMVGVAFGGGGGSSDVVPNYSVAPVKGVQNVLTALKNTGALVTLVTVDDANSNLATAQAAAAKADAVIIMAGTISEEGADRATFDNEKGVNKAVSIGDGLDWYSASVSKLVSVGRTDGGKVNPEKDSKTVAMIEGIMAATSSSGKAMPAKTALVLKDNAGVAMPASLLGTSGPAILETWFPGQEDGNIVAALLFGKDLSGNDVSPTGKLPVTFPVAGKGFLDSISALQFPGEWNGTVSTVKYTEGLNIGYRWYDAQQKSGACATNADGSNACVAFPFGHGLSYTAFSATTPTLAASGAKQVVKTTVTNTGAKAGAEVVQVYLGLPAVSSVGDKTGVTLVQPPKRLVGFQKVSLAKGASSEVTISIDPDATNHPMSVWNQTAKKWEIPSGTFTVYVGKSSSPKDLVQVGTFTK